MKNVIKLITPMLLMLLFAVSSSAQVAPTKVSSKKNCDPKACDISKCADKKNCDPSLCNLLTSLCKKGTKTAMATTTESSEDNTRVAAAKVERTADGTASKKNCASTEGKKCCAKKGN